MQTENSKIKFIAKSVWKKEELQPKLDAGCDGIEYQILDPKKDPFLKADWWDEDLASHAYSVHLPLILKSENGRLVSSDCGLGTEDFDFYFPIVCERVQQIINSTKRKIHINLHLENSHQELLDFGLWDKSVKKLQQFADFYPDIIFSVENVTRLLAEPMSNADLVDEVNRPNVGTTLDTCHAMITEYKTRLLETIEIPVITTEDFFKRYSKDINWLHLNNAVESKDGFGTHHGHGAPFDPESTEHMANLQTFVDYAKNYFKDSELAKEGFPIVIEVREEDYTTPPINYIKTKEALCQILG